MCIFFFSEASLSTACGKLAKNATQSYAKSHEILSKRKFRNSGTSYFYVISLHFKNRGKLLKIADLRTEFPIINKSVGDWEAERRLSLCAKTLGVSAHWVVQRYTTLRITWKRPFSNNTNRFRTSFWTHLSFSVHPLVCLSVNPLVATFEIFRWNIVH